MTIKFNDKNTYNVVKTLGVVRKDGGYLQISQKTNQDGPDVDPTETLTFKGRDGGKLWFIRPDGTEIVGHRSHFDQEDPYNKEGGKKRIKTSDDAKANVSGIEDQMAQAQAELDAMLNEETAEASEEADELFAQA